MLLRAVAFYINVAVRMYCNSVSLAEILKLCKHQFLAYFLQSYYCFEDKSDTWSFRSSTLWKQLWSLQLWSVYWHWHFKHDQIKDKTFMEWAYTRCTFVQRLIHSNKKKLLRKTYIALTRFKVVYQIKILKTYISIWSLPFSAGNVRFEENF